MRETVGQRTDGRAGAAYTPAPSVRAEERAGGPGGVEPDARRPPPDQLPPRLSGFAVTRFIRRGEGLRRVPVVSGRDPLKHRNLALAAGRNAYLQKPLDLDRLGELINDLLPAT